MLHRIMRIALPVLLAVLILGPLAAYAVSGLPNPLGGEDMTLVDLIIRLIHAFLGVIGLFAFTMFIVGGFQMLTSAGIPDRIQKGKDTLLWAVVGLIVVATAWQIVQFILAVLKNGTMG